MNCSTITHTVASKKTATNKSKHRFRYIRCSLGTNMKIRPDDLISDTKFTTKKIVQRMILVILPIAEEHSPSI
jgi:hypothetical protein